MATKGTARLERMKRRAEGVQVREDYALEKYAAGLTIVEITAKLAEVFGTSGLSVSNTWEMVRRSLRRHSVNPDDVDIARAKITLHLEKLLEVWLPRSLGHVVLPDGSQLPPSDKAATVVLQTLDRYAQVTGAVKPPEKTTNIQVNVAVPMDADGKRQAVMEELRREAAKLVVIDGELANAGTSLAANRQDGGGRQALLPPPDPTKEKP